MKIKATYRPYENGATQGFADVIVNGSIGIKGVALMQGENGLFASFPSIKVGENDYRDVVTGVSKEFHELLLEAVLAAKESPEKKASIGERGNLYYNARATALEQESSCKALASLTVKEGEQAEKSAFTISNIRIMEGEKGMFVSMPSVKTNNPEYPYNELCFVTDSNASFVHNLIMNKAKKALGIEKPSIDEQVQEAGNTVKESAEKAGRDGKKAEKEQEK